MDAPYPTEKANDLRPNKDNRITVQIATNDSMASASMSEPIVSCLVETYRETGDGNNAEYGATER
jgi:hypothetical protein